MSRADVIAECERATAYQTALAASAVVTNAINYVKDTRDGCSAAAGLSAGYALKWAHRMVDLGADTRDVRELLRIGMRGGA